jgi:NADP-dependent 3-hydroxy acid dehydrogenase YdfG
MFRPFFVLILTLLTSGNFFFPTAIAMSPTLEVKSILITGATTGIGRNLAETLAARGYHVYGGARTDTEMKELDAISNITAIRLDVTKQDQVD